MHDFAPLLQQYPSIIATLPETFNSHTFILALAWRQQALYVEALAAYRDADQGPFRVVHGILANRLNTFPELVENTGCTVSSPDIFGNPGNAVLWQKR